MRTWLLPALLVASAAACAGGAPRGVGMSEPGQAPSTAPKPADAGSDAAAFPRDYRTQFVKLSSARFVSQGHAGGRFNGELFGNALAKESWDRATGEYPVGAVLIMEHAERSAEGPAGPTMLMEKRAKGFDPKFGDWRYSVLDSKGQLQKEGAIETCALCHADAPRDFVFRLP